MAKKPLKFYQTLNQAPRSAKHGAHRRAGKTAHRYSSFGADYSAGGADQSVTYFYASSGQSWTVWNPFESEPVAIPYAGLRTGEIIGHRAWYVIGDGLTLTSIAHIFPWEPGATIEGDINKDVGGNFYSIIYGGTYCFHSADLCREETKVSPDFCFPCHAYIGFGFTEIHGIVRGTIKMWGEVVEHEKGYRAQFAKIASLDEADGAVDLEAIKAKYFSP